MCGRFAITLPDDAMARIFQAAPANDLPPVPNYNVCPTDRVHVVRAGPSDADHPGRHLVAMRWGFVPHWYKTLNDGPLLINARAETIAAKPAFRAACRERRCILPVSGFYEWMRDPQDRRLPWYFHPAGAEVLALAGIWQRWTDPQTGEALDSCAIVTTAAGPAMAQIHHREPLSLAASEIPLWLGEEGADAARLMRPAPDDRLARHRVATEVNSNKASGADLIAPAGAAP